MDRRSSLNSSVRPNSGASKSTLVTIEQAILLAHIARHGPIKGKVIYISPHRRIVDFGALNRTVIGQLSRMRFVALDISAGTVKANRSGLIALDMLCETIWPESMTRMMNGLHNADKNCEGLRLFT